MFKYNLYNILMCAAEGRFRETGNERKHFGNAAQKTHSKALLAEVNKLSLSCSQDGSGEQKIYKLAVLSKITLA